jgi:alcohol dehydrogenase (NADP+)
MLDYCAAHDIVSDVEVINIDYINEAYERMMRGDVRYRFVIDIASLK